MTCIDAWAVIDRATATARLPDGSVHAPYWLAGTPKPGPDCGTRRGYRAHRRNREQPCTPCRRANTRYQSDWAHNRGAR